MVNKCLWWSNLWHDFLPVLSKLSWFTPKLLQLRVGNIKHMHTFMKQWWSSEVGLYYEGFESAEAAVYIHIWRKAIPETYRYAVYCLWSHQLIRSTDPWLYHPGLSHLVASCCHFDLLTIYDRPSIASVKSTCRSEHLNAQDIPALIWHCDVTSLWINN